MSLESNVPSEPATTVEHSSGAIDSGRPLALPDALYLKIVAHLTAWLPNEGCGLLASTPDGPVDRAIHFFPGTNIDRSPVRYTMDPVEVIGAMRRMREEGWDMAAIVHSHPRTLPEPSRTDRSEAYYPNSRLLIVSFIGQTPEIQSWALVGDDEARTFSRVPLAIGIR